MNELYEITGLDSTRPLNELVEALKAGRNKAKLIEKAKKELDPMKHDVMNPILRRGKWVEIPNPNGIKGEKGQVLTSRKWVEPNRIPVAYQKIIVKRAKAFLFGNKPSLKANLSNDNELERNILETLERILFDVKEQTLNRRVADALFSFTEVAEIWYFNRTDTNHKTYGFETKLDASVLVLSASDGDLIYPYYNSFKKLVAFSRAYITHNNGGEVHVFETYTKGYIYQFTSNNGWELSKDYPKGNILNKIPVTFAEQPNVEWYEIQNLIDRLERLLSDHAEVNDRNACPILAIKGKMKTFFEKGPGGMVELNDGAEIQYVSWDNATESVKLEIETLVENIHMITQTPNISMKEMKSLGALSGTALQMLFLDAHLKVMDKREIFDEYLQRRINLIKTMIGVMKPEWKQTCENMRIEPTIVPFMVENEKEKIENALLENGNKPLKSHEKSVREWQGQESDDFDQIESENVKEAKLNYYEPSSYNQ